MIRDLIEMYNSGAITTHHMAVQCLQMLDPAKPDLVLAPLPDEILAAISKFAEGYNAERMKTNYGDIPSQDQIIAAAKWLRERNGKFVRTE